MGLNAHLYSSGEGYRGAGVSRYIHSLLTYLPQVDATLDYVAFVGAPAARWP
ncbi:MAG: glycosyltransferase family 1 protein, partial [Chloroflexi bacterium]|nr:glycosyltransferase family 1 protein [Chloroflexota bacterium]